MKKWILALACVYSSFTFAATETYTIDQDHSFANFTIRHVVAKTSGVFNDVSGIINIDREHLANSSVSASIDVASVSTGLPKRDEHIQAAKYLDAMHFGKMTFVSKAVSAKDQMTALVTGDLTIHGVTKSVTIPMTILGFGADPWGGERSGFEANFTIKASDYGFTWMKTPNAPVGDEIAINLLIEGVKVKE